MTTDAVVAEAPWIPLGFPTPSRVDLPSKSENLFRRLIRNPRPSDRPPKERECAEMLASVLILAPRIRDELVSWWLQEDVDLQWLAGLRFEVETEGSIPDGKRDDLRLEGLSDEEDPEVLITVEVKVGSGFHLSSSIDDHGLPEENLDHQVAHYDAWLSSQPHRARRGIVIAPTDRSEGLPERLASSWSCLTWGEVGRTVAGLLEEEELSPTERFLGRHLVGFIQDELGDITVDTDQLSFDDIAFLRAARRMGKDVTKRVDNLVAPLMGLFEELGVGVDGPVHQKNVMSGNMRSVVWRYLYEGDQSVYLMAGIVTENGLGLVTWLESSPRHPKKSKIQAVVQEYLPALREADFRWSSEGNESPWWDLTVRAPLHDLLAVEDQAGEIQAFVQTAFVQLRDSGFIAALGTALAEDEEEND